MIEKLLIILLPLLYLATFTLRNLLVKIRTQQAIKAADPLLTSAIVFTAGSILITILSIYSTKWYYLMGAISLFRFPLFSYLGFILFGISIFSGWIISAQLKQSWRVGIHPDQKTELVDSGIYAYVRNPYFLSYFLMYAGLFLVRPSLVLAVFLAVTVALFHALVLKEEAYLKMVHGAKYEVYKRSTGRYLPIRTK